MSDTLKLQKISTAGKLAEFDELWSPKVVGELNGQYVKLVKFRGEYVWHHHENEDEMFYIISGTMLLHMRSETITVEPGEFIIIPRGVEHKPEAESECHAMLFEPASTRNTGNVDHGYTIEPGDLEHI